MPGGPVSSRHNAALASSVCKPSGRRVFSGGERRCRRGASLSEDCLLGFALLHAKNSVALPIFNFGIASSLRPPMSTLLNKLERAFGRFAIANLSLYLVAGQVMVFILVWFDKISIGPVLLIPAYVLHGELWRVLTFVLVPHLSSPGLFGYVFIAFSWWIFYLMGSALEDYWGVFRYNLFLFMGWALTVGAAFLAPDVPATNLFVAGSVFLAFAYLNPDFELWLYFLPVKVKWLGLFMWVRYA
jgi:hypothetical protein